MKLFRAVGVSALLGLVLAGCGPSEKSLEGRDFKTQWVKVGGRDMILIDWHSDSNKFSPYNIASLRYGSPAAPKDGNVWIFSMETSNFCEWTNRIVVDPMQVCDDLKSLKLKAKTNDGWTDIPLPPRVAGMDKFWGQP